MKQSQRVELQEYSSEFLNTYLPENYPKENTRRQYEYAVREFITYVDNRNWTFGLHPDKVHDDVERIREFYEETDVTNPKTNGIRRFIEYIGKQLSSKRQLACEQVSELISYQKVTDRKQRTGLTANDIKQYLLDEQQIESALEKASFKQKLIIKILLDTGMRIGELAALKVEDVDFEPSEDIGAAIQINKTYVSGTGIQDMPKSADGRRAVELHSDTAELFSAFIDMNDIRGKIFTGVSNLRKKFKQPFLAAGVETFEDDGEVKCRVTPHWMRHIFITWQTRKGTDLDRLMQVTGHSNRETLQEYQHLSEYDVVGIYA